jgi:hypothetical protein
MTSRLQIYGNALHSSTSVLDLMALVISHMARHVLPAFPPLL